MNEGGEMLVVVLALAIAAIAMCTHPSRANCPDGHDLRMGIRRSGDFECWSRPVGDPDYDGTFGKPERSVQPGPVYRGRIYCTGGAQPIVVDYRTVGCQR